MKKPEFRNLVGQEEYQRYVDIGVATHYKASFSSYVTAIRFDSNTRLSDVTSDRKWRRSDGKGIREVVDGHNVLNFAINDLWSGGPVGPAGQRLRRFYPTALFFLFSHYRFLGTRACLSWCQTHNGWNAHAFALHLQYPLEIRTHVCATCFAFYCVQT